MREVDKSCLFSADLRAQFPTFSQVIVIGTVFFLCSVEVLSMHIGG